MSVCEEGVSCRTAPTTPSREIQRPHSWVLRSAAVQCSQATSASPSRSIVTRATKWRSIGERSGDTVLSRPRAPDALRVRACTSQSLAQARTASPCRSRATAGGSARAGLEASTTGVDSVPVLE
jgi:hypothetical protein